MSGRKIKMSVHIVGNMKVGKDNLLCFDAMHEMFWTGYGLALVELRMDRMRSGVKFDLYASGESLTDGDCIHSFVTGDDRIDERPDPLVYHMKETRSGLLDRLYTRLVMDDVKCTEPLYATFTMRLVKEGAKGLELDHYYEMETDKLEMYPNLGSSPYAIALLSIKTGNIFDPNRRVNIDVLDREKCSFFVDGKPSQDTVYSAMTNNKGALNEVVSDPFYCESGRAADMNKFVIRFRYARHYTHDLPIKVEPGTFRARFRVVPLEIA